MRRHSGRVLSFLGLIAAAWTSLGAATAIAQVACPPNVSVEQKASASNEWSIDYSKAPAALSSATIFEGPPEEQVSLKYDSERTTRNEIIQTWELPKSDHGYWLVCGYTNTTARLRRKLPDDASHCEVVLEKNITYGDAAAVVKRAECVAHKPGAKVH